MRAEGRRSDAAGSLEERKDALRSRMAARRQRLEPDLSEQAGRLAAERLRQLVEFQRASAVALYAALPDELPTRPVFDACVRSGAGRLLPRCRPDGDLDFVFVERWEDLRRGRYGLLEPPPDWQSAPLHSADLVVVPGVAFDRMGRRLGRGRGYYDRALGSEQGGRALRVGFAFAFQIVERVPSGPLDQGMDLVVTEAAMLWAAQKGTGK